MQHLQRVDRAVERAITPAIDAVQSGSATAIPAIVPHGVEKIAGGCSEGIGSSLGTASEPASSEVSTPIVVPMRSGTPISTRDATQSDRVENPVRRMMAWLARRDVERAASCSSEFDHRHPISSRQNHASGPRDRRRRAPFVTPSVRFRVVHGLGYSWCRRVVLDAFEQRIRGRRDGSFRTAMGHPISYASAIRLAETTSTFSRNRPQPPRCSMLQLQRDTVTCNIGSWLADSRPRPAQSVSAPTASGSATKACDPFSSGCQTSDRPSLHSKPTINPSLQRTAMRKPTTKPSSTRSATTGETR